jgi:hypothetical protein
MSDFLYILVEHPICFDGMDKDWSSPPQQLSCSGILPWFLIPDDGVEDNKKFAHTGG